MTRLVLLLCLRPNKMKRNVFLFFIKHRVLIIVGRWVYTYLLTYSMEQSPS